MATKLGKKLTPFYGLHLKAKSKNQDAVLHFDTVNTAPTTTSGYRWLYVNGSSQLIFDNGSTTTALGASGVVSSFSLNDAYDDGSTVTVDTGSVAFNGVGMASGVLALAADAASSGALLTFAQSGSGNDITGTSSTWSVTKAGVATFVGVTLGDAQVLTFGATADVTIQWVDGSSWLEIDGTVHFKDSVSLLAGSTFIIGGAGGSTMFTITEGDALMSDGSLTMVDADNAATLSVTNNTATTVGAAASSGVATLISTSLTTGALLNLQLTEGTLNGGWYIRAWDATAGAGVFSVGEDGATTIAGVGGSNVLTVTAGDVVLSDGSVTVTDADNAASFSVTNNTATTASVLVFAGSGTFTGSTTSSFATLTASGLTTGTVLYVPAAALTTGKVLHVSATAATDGVLFDVTGGGANMTATGKLMTLAMGAATVGNGLAISTTGVYTGTGLLTLTADSATTGNIFAISANGLTTGTAMTLISTGTIVTTGEMVSIIANSATTTTGLVRISATGLTDGYAMEVTGGGANFTATGGMFNLNMGAATVGAGIKVATTGVYTGSGLLQLTADSATTGVIASVSANGLTSGTALSLTSTGTITTNGEMLLVTANSATSSTGLVRISGTGLTSGTALSVTGGGANMNSGGSVLYVNAGAATDGKAILVDCTGVFTGGPLVTVNANSLTTGYGVGVSVTGLTTGYAGYFLGGTSMASGGALVFADMGAATAGSGVKITTTGVFTGTDGLLDINAASATTGTIVDVGVAGLTTGIALNIGNANGLTTGSIARFISNSADTSARNLVFVHNDHASATGAVALALRSDAAVSTNFRKIMTMGNGTQTVTFWISDGSTSPNTALTGTAGDVCFGADSGKSYYCTGTTNWTAFA